VGKVRHRRETIGVPLALGFGVLLILIVAATVITLRKSFEIFELLARTHERHYQVAEALMRLRSDLYVAGILKRDFLLERNPDEAASYGDQFAGIQASADHNLDIIQQTLGNAQPEAVTELRAEVSDYLRPLKEALDWNLIVPQSLRSFLLRAQLEERSAVFQMASEIEELNQDSLAVQQSRIRVAGREFRRTLLLISVASLLLGVAVAAFTIFYTRKLQHHSDEVQLELKRLSQHVVKAQEHERKSISRELHDEVGQMLTGLRMELANLDVPAIQQNAADYQRLQEAKRLTESTLQCVRNLSMLLRPSMLDDLGLSPALRWQAREFSKRSGIPVNLLIDGEVDGLPDEVRTCVYRVVQEALTNVARHANAGRIDLNVQRLGQEILLTIEDDGDGFDVLKPSRTAGIGLIGLKERVWELSGAVQIDSENGKGTRISVHLPVLEGASC
jgi:signal transduction histidine kinase